MPIQAPIVEIVVEEEDGEVLMVFLKEREENERKKRGRKERRGRKG